MRYFFFMLVARWKLFIIVDNNHINTVTELSRSVLDMQQLCTRRCSQRRISPSPKVGRAFKLMEIVIYKHGINTKGKTRPTQKNLTYLNLAIRI